MYAITKYCNFSIMSSQALQDNNDTHDDYDLRLGFNHSTRAEQPSLTPQISQFFDFNDLGFNMVTWMKEQGDIDVHFGFDANMGYFLIVYDMRLAAYIPDRTEFDDVRYAVSADGTGAYFTAYTGTHRQGRRVSVETMRKLWKAYGVYEEGNRGLWAAGSNLSA
ncbi:hypothetical protein BDV32DRAFT_146313 [Aspergillus pseudonomiae]|nr:hypothetical protein BDV32DRAFT_146313 [Aspergillus pseudonomiae]